MAVLYELPVPELHVTSAGHLTIDRWLVNPGDWVNEGTPVAVIAARDGCYEVLANGRGVIEHVLRELGSTVEPGDAIAVIEADGESVPYRRPYSVARRA